MKKINDNKLKGCSVLVVRIGEGGCLRNAKPCANCTIFLKKLPLDKIYYPDENGDIVWVRNKDLKSDFITSGFRNS